MKAIMIGAQSIQLGQNEVVVAGGVEVVLQFGEVRGDPAESGGGGAGFGFQQFEPVGDGGFAALTFAGDFFDGHFLDAIEAEDCEEIGTFAPAFGVKDVDDRANAAGEFFVDYLTTSLSPGEILTGVRVPKLGPGWGYRYVKFHRTAQAWATVGVAALARRSNGQVAEARIGLTNMGSVPLRASAAEAAMAGADASAAAVSAAAAAAADGTQPPADLHGAPDYRRHLARVLTGRALAAAAGV